MPEKPVDSPVVGAAGEICGEKTVLPKNALLYVFLWYTSRQQNLNSGIKHRSVQVGCITTEAINQ
jgi:hypothetical protein